MKIKTRMSSISKPINTPLTKGKMAAIKSTIDPLQTNLEDYNLSALSKGSKPELIHPCDLQELEKPNLSMQNLLLDAFTQSEKIQEDQIHYLYEKQAKLTQALVEAKKKMIELHKSSDSTLSLWQPTIDTVLPLCISIVALYLGFSPEYSLSKISAICTSVIGFAIAGLKMVDIEIPSYLSSCYIAIFNLYMAYMNPANTLTYITTFLQTLPIISNFFYTIDDNSICSDKALAQKTIQSIDRDLKNVTLEISRAMKMIAGKGKFFSITTDYTQLQNKIAAIGAA